MKTLSSNDLNDIYLGTDGNLSVSTGLQACLESCRRAAQVRLGELPYAQSRGAPFFQIMEDKNLSLYEMYITNMARSVPGVTGVESVEFSIDEDNLNYTATINTIYGTGTISNG